MGDRGNIAVKQSNGQDVYLYSHWSGSELPLVVRDALARKQRWSDAPYLTRIIFDTMTVGQQGEETGYGITTEETDRNHPTIFVDPGQQYVTISGRRLSFERYAQLQDFEASYED